MDLSNMLYNSGQSPPVHQLGRTQGAPYRGYGYVPLRFWGNVVRRMGKQQQQLHWDNEIGSILAGKNLVYLELAVNVSGNSLAHNCNGQFHDTNSTAHSK